MDLKSELQTVEKKLLEKKEQIELEVLKVFDAYSMQAWSYDAADCFASDMDDLRDEYNQIVATLQAVRTVIDMKELE